MLKRLALIAVLACTFSIQPAITQPDMAYAASKNKAAPKRTAAQRAKYMEEGRRVCKKKYGAIARLHHIDWSTLKVWCAVNW